MNKKLLINILIAITSVIVFFTMIETLQRVRYYLKYHSTYWLCYGFMPMPKDYSVMLENVILGGSKNIHNIEANVMNYDGYYKYNPRSPNVKEHINSKGFRGNEIKLKSKFRIVALGDSTTFGSLVNDGLTYPEYLSKKTGYEVINAGIEGFTTDNVLNLFKKEIVSLSPDMIIVNCMVNNFLSSKNIYSSNALHKTSIFLLNKSLFYMTLREKIRKIAKKPIVDIYRGSFNNVLNAFLEDKEFYESFKKDYNSIIDFAKKNSIKVVIIKEPAWIRAGQGMIFETQFKTIWDKMYVILDEVGIERDVKVFGIDVPKNEEYFIDGVHLTPKGNKYFADTICKKLFSQQSL